MLCRRLMASVLQCVAVCCSVLQCVAVLWCGRCKCSADGKCPTDGMGVETSGERVAKTHRTPYLSRPYSAKDPYNEWRFCAK